MRFNFKCLWLGERGRKLIDKSKDMGSHLTFDVSRRAMLRMSFSDAHKLKMTKTNNGRDEIGQQIPFPYNIVVWSITHC